MNKKSWLALGVTLAIVFSLSNSSWALLYTYRDLNSFYDYDSFQVTRINATGQVAGSHTGTPTHACFGSGARPLLDLGTLYSNPNLANSHGLGLNKLGQVVGDSGAFLDINQNMRTRGFLWTAQTGMTRLKAIGDGPFTSLNDSYAYSINELGQIVGYSTISGGGTRAVLWSPGGALQALGVLAGNNSSAYDINKSGQVAGRSTQLNASQQLVGRAFLWTSQTGMQDLGMPYDWNPSDAFASAINDQGRIVGVAAFPGQEQIIWWPSGPGSAEWLPMFLGDRYFATGINNAGTVVGYYYKFGYGPWALVWNTNTGAYDLNRRVVNLPGGVILEKALSINDGGQIVGLTNTGRSFLLTPAPAPPVGVLLLDD